MKLALRQLDKHLTDGLAKVYLVAGDETLLVDEALEQIRAAAKRADFTMRELHAADRIRQELTARGIAIEDVAGGPARWRRTR